MISFSPTPLPQLGEGLVLLPSPVYGESEARGAKPVGGEGLWRSGQAVFHTKFGEGVIVNLEGSGADARVQVNFRKAGVKWLALEYAKLTAI